jgi:hypothetical protein
LGTLEQTEQRRLSVSSPFAHPQNLWLTNRPFKLGISSTVFAKATGHRCGTNAGLITEPLLFYLSFAKKARGQQPTEHSTGLRELTRLELIMPAGQTNSPELQAAVDANLIQMRTGAEHWVELEFDGGWNGRKADFRLDLPLIFSW